jgi:hypothetical protein
MLDSCCSATMIAIEEEDLAVIGCRLGSAPATCVEGQHDQAGGSRRATGRTLPASAAALDACPRGYERAGLVRDRSAGPRRCPGHAGCRRPPARADCAAAGSRNLLRRTPRAWCREHRAFQRQPLPARACRISSSGFDRGPACAAPPGGRQPSSSGPVAGHDPRQPRPSHDLPTGSQSGPGGPARGSRLS